MKKNEVTNFEAFLNHEEASSLSITYQSIKGIVWDLSEYKNVKRPHYAYMEKYNSEESYCSPFYKNISKFYAK